uniref:Uncharacterized protein n=1 Tax=viral metagenome TaxID=1070528 RepID=A0A6M3XHE7_9ZZZZ
MRRGIVTALGALLLGATLAWSGERLFNLQVGTLRARRVEIVDEVGHLRMILTVHRDRPALTFYDEAGEPMAPVFVGEAGVILAPGLE